MITSALLTALQFFHSSSASLDLTNIVSVNYQVLQAGLSNRLKKLHEEFLFQCFYLKWTTFLKIIWAIMVTAGDQFMSESGTELSKDSWNKDCVVMRLCGSDCGIELPDPRRPSDAQLWVF